jgi:hypothetical protein
VARKPKDRFQTIYGGPPRPIRLRGGAPPFPSGPKWLKKPKLLSGPGEPPPEFLFSMNSRTEWMVYWALWKIFKDEGDPRVPPFLGSPSGSWSYQTPVEGGRRQVGGAIVDFVIENTPQPIALRIQTERFHVFTDPNQIGFDRDSLIMLSQGMRVADVYEQDFIHDKSGVACIVALKRAILAIDPGTPLERRGAYRNRIK